MLTLTAFKDRAPEGVLAQLTDHQNGAVVDDVVCRRALEDAWSEVEGYTYQLASPPPTHVLQAHQFHLAMYRLVGGRPGTEFESYAKRYESSVKYLDALANGAGDRGVIADAEQPEALFDEGSMTEFGKLVAPE